MSPANKTAQNPTRHGASPLAHRLSMRLEVVAPPLFVLLLLSGCPAPLPPVHAQIAGGAATQPAGREKDPTEQLLAYNARLGVNPLGYSKQYDYDPVFDIGVGYELEQMPLASDVPTTHGPYTFVEFWPDLKPRTDERLGLRVYAEFLILEATGSDDGPGPRERSYGYGATLALGWEETGSTKTGIWKRERSAPVLGYGRIAAGLFAGPSVRRVDDQTYVLVMVGGSLRMPVSVSDLAPK